MTCNCSILNFLIYEENLVFFFISTQCRGINSFLIEHQFSLHTIINISAFVIQIIILLESESQTERDRIKYCQSVSSWNKKCDVIGELLEDSPRTAKGIRVGAIVYLLETPSLPLQFLSGLSEFSHIQSLSQLISP